MFKIINLIKNKSHKEIYLTLFLSFFWFFLWASINVEPKWIGHFANNLVGTINSLRISIPLIISIITTLIIFLLIKKIKLNNLIFIYYIYFIFQTIGLIFNLNVDFTLGNNFLIILGIGTLNIFIIMKILNYENYSKMLLFFSVCFCFLFMFLIFYLNFDKLIEYLAFSTFYSISRPGDFLFGSAYPRSTGLSRICALLALILFVLYINISKKRLFKKILFLICITFFSIFVWGFQSRGTIICYSISVLMCLFLFKSEFKEKIINFFLILLLPVLIFNQSAQIAKKHYIKKHLLEKDLFKEVLDVESIEELKLDLDEEEFKVFKKKLDQALEKTGDANRFVKRGMSTSGRFDIWKYSLSQYDKKKIFGYGAQADRYLLNDKYKGYGNNSSNIFLYVFLSGGYFSLLILILIFLRAYYISGVILFMKNKSKIKNSFIFQICFSILIFFSVRGLIENSFGLFSIDFLFTILCLFIINELYNNKIDTNFLKI